VNALGYLRVMFAVEDIDDTLARLRKHGAQLVGEVVRTKTRIGSATSGAQKESHRLAQQLGQQTSRANP